jgi:hypothetical protein
MIDQNETTLNKVLRYAWTFIKHPLTILAIGILVALSIYLLSRKEKEPVFTISPPDLVAQTVPGEEKLKIIWENKEIQNAASVKIAIWNDGSQFIDKNDFASTDPMRIVPSGKVSILAVQMLKTSRPNLKFDTTIETSPDGIGSVLIKIKGDEALEKFDGALFHILFSGSQNINWKVIGRIKGAPEGFHPKDWAKIHSTPYPPRTWFLLVSGCLALLFPFSILIIEHHRHIERKHWSDWIFFILFLGGFEFIFLRGIFIGLSYKVLPLWLLK